MNQRRRAPVPAIERILAAETEEEIFAIVKQMSTWPMRFRLLSTSGLVDVEDLNTAKVHVIAHWRAVFKYVSEHDSKSLNTLQVTTIGTAKLETRTSEIDRLIKSGTLSVDHMSGRIAPWRITDREST
jgi:hypothetical protein